MANISIRSIQRLVFINDKNYMLIHSLREFQAINGEESPILGN